MIYKSFYMARLNAEDLEGLRVCVAAHHGTCPRLADLLQQALSREAERRSAADGGIFYEVQPLQCAPSDYSPAEIEGARRLCEILLEEFFTPEALAFVLPVELALDTEEEQRRERQQTK